ncbi:MAG: S8 family serine peptidase [Deltaproteobacteria bacterium]|nr:S8 family serine peptidase [Deltaproteobacteria bacterium]
MFVAAFALALMTASPDALMTPRVLAKARSEVSAPVRDAAFARAGVRVLSRHFERVYLLEAKSMRAAKLAEASLRSSRLFDYVERDVVTKREPAYRPDDALYSQLWHLENIAAEAAWDTAQGDASVIIAIIDSGVQTTHPDLQAKIVAPYDAIRDQDGAEPDPGVESAHGTACAGIAAAATSNNEGIAGICPKCRLMPIKLVGQGGWAATSADVRAFEHAWKNGAAVISNSWGPRTPQAVSAALEDAINEATVSGRGGKGAVVVFAAGNGYRENGAAELPSLASVIAVGASLPDDTRADYSNFGPFVPLYAPAASHTTDPPGIQGFAPGSYTTSFGGTSAAAPVVAGIAGVLLAMNPALKPVQVKAVLIATADKVQASVAAYDATGRSATYGYGRVNMQRAVEAVRDGHVCQPSAGGEACGNGVDDDCNGLVDALDPPCAPTCNTSGDCASDKICDVPHHRCVPKVAPGSSVGAACASSQQCGAQAFCLSDAPDGYCTLSCSATAPCPVGAGCFPYGAVGATVCLQRCRFNPDCREGYACAPQNDTDSACLPACAEDSACGDGRACSEGRCVDAPPGIEDAAAPHNGSAVDVSFQTRGCRCGNADASALWLVVIALIRARSRSRACS